MPVFQKQSLDKFNPVIMLLELVVIVIGISASFWVDEWPRSNRRAISFRDSPFCQRSHINDLSVSV
jgi:hypothetical protein